MCGVLALLTKKKNENETLKLVQEMLVPLQESRGPDASGIEKVELAHCEQQVYLAHARLSIIDTTEKANQPMVDEKSGLHLIFNGEIYNYRELRAELDSAFDFKTSSDTEVLLAAFREWGVDQTLLKIRGMFAFVLVDQRKKKIWAARDRAGEKPLSYGRVGSDWVFTSDLRVLQKHPQWTREISLHWLKTYFRYRFVPHPHSIFKGFSKLGPGQLLTMSIEDDVQPEVYNYWNFAETWSQQPRVENVNFRKTLREVVVRTTQASDVPMGCFLSGGVDSTLVTTLAAQNAGRDLHAFTIQFEDPDFDESELAKQVAKTLGIKHTVVPFGFAEFKTSFQSLNHFLDEPNAVHSFYPLGYLAKRAKQDVKVCLSGDGGDELFAGYNRYVFWQNYMSKVMSSPQWMRKGLLNLLRSGRSQKIIETMLQASGQRQVQSKLEKILRSLDVDNMEDYYQKLLCQQVSPLGEGGEYHLDIEDLDGLHAVEKLMALDFSFYLPCDVLNKVDRATMANGLEARAPLLDLDVIEAAGHIPISQKINGEGGKIILKKWLNDLLPDLKHSHPKSGFTTPIEKWRPQLFDAEFFELLDESPLRNFVSDSYFASLSSGEFSGEEGFSLYCVTHWMHTHGLTIN